MNDFTKEELLLIRACITYGSGTINGPCSEETNPLKNKVVHLINNYCEHEWEDGPKGYDQCGKCGVMNDN